jgi:Ca2+-binding EF-hand superfamily protein
MTLRNAFLIADNDGNEELSKEEFFRVVTKILSVNVTEAEQAEYWSRMTRGSGKNVVTFGQLLTFFGNLLDAELLGRNGKDNMQSGVKDINTVFKSNDIEGQLKFNAERVGMLCQQLSNELKLYMKKEEINTKDLFDIFDQNRDHRLQRYEFVAVCQDTVKVSMNPRDLETIYEYVDKDDTNSVDLVELFKLINFNMDEFLKSEAASRKNLHDPENPENFNTNRVLLEFLKAVREYMKEKEMTIYQFFSMLDKSKDSKISRAEIKSFITKTMKLKLSEKHIEIILNKMDSSGDYEITVKEFMKFMELEESLALLNNKLKVDGMKNLTVLSELYGVMNARQMTVLDVFTEMDKDKGGSVDTVEMGLYLQRLKLNCSSDDIEKFLLFVDNDMSKTVSFDEFKVVLDGYFMWMDSEREISPEKRDELLSKLIPLIEDNKERLRALLDIHQEKQGYIAVDSFDLALKKTKLFTNEDISLIINPLCKPFTDNKRIRYEGLFNLKKLYSHNNKLRESGVSGMRGAKLVNQIFRALKKVAKKHNIENFELFECFDVKRDGQITLKEMR